MKKPNTDSTSKRARLQAAFSSRYPSNNEKKPSTIPTDSLRITSQTNNDTSGPGGGKTTGSSEVSANADSTNVAAALVPHVNSTTPVASGKSQTTSSSLSTKEFLTRRVRSRSKTDAQSVPDKSLFSKFFSKKSKKPLGTLITTMTNSIDLNPKPKRTYLTNQSSLTTDETHSTIDEAEQEGEEDEYGDDETLDQSMISSGSMSDISCPPKTTSESKSKVRPNPVKIPRSDPQYYASMTSAPKGFSISYHQCMTKGNDNIRLQQTPFGRSQKGAGADGANQLKVCLMLFHPFLFA